MHGVLHLTSVPAALISQISGALVSYVLTRWAWERKGKPDVLRETIPFWVVFGVATVISTLATKLGYHIAASMHLHGFKHVLVVEGVYLVANVVTFLMRFVIFHYVLFADRAPESRDAATGWTSWRLARTRTATPKRRSPRPGDGPLRHVTPAA